MKIRTGGLAVFAGGWLLLVTTAFMPPSLASQALVGDPTPAPEVTTPIQPSNSTSIITEVALLMVSAGGVLAAIPPIVKVFRKVPDENSNIDEDEQARIILAAARVIASEERRASEAKAKEEGK